MHTIAIVIPSYKRPELLDKLLTSISEANLPESLKSIWVVENGSRAGAINVCDKWLEKLPINYLYSDIPSASNARNMGFQASKEDFIIFFDNDIRCGKYTISAYDIAIQKYSFQFYYGGPLSIDYEEEPESWLLEYLPWSVQGMSKGIKECIIKEPIFLARVS